MQFQSRTMLAAAALSVGLLSATGANAALVSVLGGLAINDTDLNVTWASNASLAATNTFGLAKDVDLGPIAGVNTYGGSYIYSDGTMTWGGALKWIDAMNASDYLGYNDWRLPTTGPVNGTSMNYNNSYNGSTDYGYNISAPGTVYAGSKGSEIAYLFYNELGNKSYCPVTTNCSPSPQTGWGISNTGLFSNLQSDGYWSGTEYAPDTNYAWLFGFSYGNQGSNPKGSSMYALAVRPGQVAAVPVPAAAWLLGSGLLGLVGIARKRKPG